MSDGMEFTVPEPVANPLTDADLERLTDEAVRWWAKRGNWTIEQACALLRGFVPLEGWEPDYPIRRILLQIHTAPLEAEITDQSAEPLPANLPPQQWLEKAEKCGAVDSAMRDAISNSKKLKPPKPDRKAAILLAADQACKELAENGTPRTPKKVAVTVCQILRNDGLRHYRGGFYGPSSIIRLLREYKYSPK